MTQMLRTTSPVKVTQTSKPGNKKIKIYSLALICFNNICELLLTTMKEKYASVIYEINKRAKNSILKVVR